MTIVENIIKLFKLLMSVYRNVTEKQIQFAINLCICIVSVLICYALILKKNNNIN